MTAVCVVYCDHGMVGLCFAGLSSEFLSMIISTILNRKGSVNIPADIYYVSNNFEKGPTTTVR